MITITTITAVALFFAFLAFMAAALTMGMVVNDKYKIDAYAFYKHYLDQLRIGANVKTYKVEIKAHFADDVAGKEAIMVQACRDAARSLLATAVMMSTNSKPEAMVQTEDFIDSITEHDIREDTQ